MIKSLSPKQLLVLLCILAAVVITIPFLLDVSALGFFFVLGIIVLVIAIFFIGMVISRARTDIRRPEIPEKYSPKHFLLLMWLTAQALIIGVMLHNGIYALGIVAFGADFWGLGDEPVFFCIATIVVPAGVIIGAIGRVWQWCVVQPIEEMKAKGIHLPSNWWYFAPFVSYAWLWKYGRGIEAITERRVRTAGVFALVFFLGIVGLVIARSILRRRMIRATV